MVNILGAVVIVLLCAGIFMLAHLVWGSIHGVLCEKRVLEHKNYVKYLKKYRDIKDAKYFVELDIEIEDATKAANKKKKGGG